MMMKTISKLLETKKVQDDFNEFIENIAKTYKKLAKIVISEIVARHNAPESEQHEIISKIYNIKFKEAKEILNQWTAQINQDLPLAKAKGLIK